MKQKTTINMSKKKFRIGELSKELQVKKFVIRFWEKEFDLKSDRSGGGQRYYTHEDFKAFNTIKHLLYKQGYTISGAKIQLESILKDKKNIETKSTENKEPVTKEKDKREITAAIKIIEKPVPYIPQEFLDKVEILKEKLLDLKQKI